MIKKILFLSLLSFNLIANAQDDSKNIGVGFDFTFHDEIKLNNYTSPPFEVKSTCHYNYTPSITYALNEKSFAGLFFGFGHGESDSYNNIHAQQEYFCSNSIGLGIFFRRNLFELHKFQVFAQPSITYNLNSQNTSIHNENGVISEFITGRQDITSFDFNIRIGVGYKISNDLGINVFLLKEIISYEKIEAETTFIKSSNDWIWFRDYIVFGMGLHYQF